jgi:transmembrane sensor
MDSERLARYVSGEADAPERQSVEQWAAASPANARELQAFTALWSMADNDAADLDVDVDRAWTALDARIGQETDPKVVPLQGRRAVWRWAAVAAVVTGLVFAARLFFTTPAQQYAATDQFVRSLLQDSSAVILSPGSSLAVKMGEERRVQLRGKAYFEVQRDTAHPFVVDAGAVEVTVLGTAFEVNAYDSLDVVLVRVREGRVRVVGGKDTVTVVAGEHARYDKRRHVLERTPAPPAEVFGERVIQFERATMLEVTEQLQRIFKVRVELRNPAIERCTLTAGFDNESIDAILRVIADTFGMRVDHPSNELYTLDGEGC